MKITFKFSYFKKDWEISHEQAQGLTKLRLSNSFHLHRAGIHAPSRSTPYPVSTRSLIVAGSRHLTSERAVTYSTPQPSASRPRCWKLERPILVLGDESTAHSAANSWSLLKKYLTQFSESAQSTWSHPVLVGVWILRKRASTLLGTSLYVIKLQQIFRVSGGAIPFFNSSCAFE